MKYLINLDGFEGQKIEVQMSSIKGPCLFINDQPVPKGKKRKMLLTRNDSKEVIATWKHNFLGLDLPSLVVDGKEIQIVEPLKWYAKVWCFVPVPLVFLGGAIGAGLGTIGISINSMIFRSSMNIFVKFLLSSLVSLFAWVAYFMAVYAITN
ncbi:hypothetical protein [Inediibacterium massiliense]|uniref:hypothetical protein n=1 Tax=Inediibacterium massiliense TaxID=1658111 RepID=UPI0006B65E97|nr:hypothetical protein [Inediibacterium massiliense]